MTRKKNMPKLRILHETNPQKYFPALFELAKDGEINLVGAHRYSVGKEWLRAWLRDKTAFRTRTRNALGDMLFRLRVPFVQGETIVVGFAPWDWRLLLYRSLARRNRILYQTSWHDWRFDRTPRQPRPLWFARYMQRQWKSFVAHPNVHVIAVTPIVAQSVRQETGVEALVIPHAVPEVFFEVGRSRKPRSNRPLKLIYVGEISEKKGIRVLVDMMAQLKDMEVSLTVVGNGALVPEVKAASDKGVTYLGPISDRAELARVMAEHDVLTLLSQRTDTWEELFGIVIVEALAAGLAVVTSDHVGQRGILGPVEGAFEEADKEGILDTIIQFSQYPDSLENCRAVQCQISEKFSVQCIKRVWLKHI